MPQEAYSLPNQIRAQPGPARSRTILSSRDGWKNWNSKQISPAITLTRVSLHSSSASRTSPQSLASRLTTYKSNGSALLSCHEDLDVLNDGLYTLGKNHDRATAMLMERNESHHTTLKELQAEIRRLEIVSAPPLIVCPRSPQLLAHSHTVPQPRQSKSPPPLRHQSRMTPRARSRSPPTKRARTDELNGFISLGPPAESAELPQKHFELHLRTAIPAFTWWRPRSPIDAWRKNTVAGYTNIEMVETTAAPETLVGNGFKTQMRRGSRMIPLQREIAVLGTWNQAKTNSTLINTSTSFPNVILWNVFTQWLNTSWFHCQLWTFFAS
ncbi:hypothetical protein C8J57DRAFT_1227715 [Mycena rebaudengoi]|nr:hypothetical protein C8J57DRAFT_1227715 [Mycena rebaudengoi]